MTEKNFIRYGDKSSRHFVSLKWKVAIWLTLLLLVANAGLAYLGYVNLKQQFEFQLQRSVARSTNFFNSLLKQARANLQNLGESLALNAGDEKSVVSELSTHLENNWDILQLNWGLESAVIFDAKGHALKSFGAVPLQADDAALAQAVAASAEPATVVRCQQSCLLIAAVPVLLRGGDLHVLMLQASIADFIIEFSRGNVDGGVLLSKTERASAPTHWGYDIVAATNRQRDSELLQIAERNLNRAQLLAGGWFKADNQHFFNLHAIPIDSRADRSTDTLLVLIEDISAQRNTINGHIRQNLIAAGIGMVASEALLLFILWAPMRRIKKQAEILPQLASGDFLTLPAGKRGLIRHFMRDELDVLEDSAADLSNRLEQMSLEINRRAQELEHMALYDHLTGLANRRLFLDHLEQAMREHERSQEKFAVLFFDLDNFKRVNDSLGHDIGDELLKEVAARLVANTRGTDTVARLSGDEFTVLLKHIDNTESVLRLGEKICKALHIPITVALTEITVTSSVGIAIAPENGLDPDQLLKNADMAMYQAKKRGRNGYYFFTEEINQQTNRLLQLEGELREALDKRQFFLQYQPLVDLRSMQIVGVEALVRWQHPLEGIVYPDRFIGIMENNGMIIDLGTQVIAYACRDLGSLQRSMRALTISVNLSPRQLRDNNLVETLEWQLRSNRIDPGLLKLEITENSLIENAEENIERLNQLKQLGLMLSIDDFGTGYSSLSYLKMLPVDELKVDRSFISDMLVDNDDREITAAVIAMAHKLQLQVVAEGVETAAQADFLASNQCDIGQGYFFSKPTSLEQIQELLNKGALSRTGG
ncbi:MAG TPA: EAL domain-containing protein [Spongiibacteraceae bacterium]